MSGHFVLARDAETTDLDWGTQRWIASPQTTGTTVLVALDVELHPGCGHDFHRHPGQEEVITVVEGEVEQWIESRSARLRPGDAAVIEPDIVHASFNALPTPARIHVVLGPAAPGTEGIAVVDVSDEAPWRDLRA